MPAQPSINHQLAADENLADLDDAATARNNLGASAALVRAAVKTAAYTAVAGDLVPVDTTSGAVTITLPTAPATGSRVAVKHIVQGSTNTVTVAAAGSDVFNKTGGSTSVTLTLVNQSVQVQYDSGIWSVVAGDLPLSGLDARYAAAGAGGSSLTVKDEGSTLATAATTLDFVGSGVVASGTGATKTITIAGGGGTALTVQDEGTPLTTDATTVNFTGAGVTATGTGATKTVDVPGLAIGSWQTLTLNGGGVTCTSCSAVSARLEGTDVVRLRGAATNMVITGGTVTGTSGGGTFTPPATPVTTLPVGLRPTARRVIRAAGSTAGAALTFVVETDGTIWPSVSIGVAAVVNFDGAGFVV